MELRESLGLVDKHHALSPIRCVRGVTCLLLLVLTALMTLVFPGFISAVLLRFFSVHYSRRITSLVFASWLALWPFLFEKINNTRVVFSGETVPVKERVLLLANHRTEVDWMYMWDLALRKSSLGYIKYVLKRSLMKLPVFGWAFHILEFIPVQRKWPGKLMNQSCIRCFRLCRILKIPSGLLFFRKAQTSLSRNALEVRDMQLIMGCLS